MNEWKELIKEKKATDKIFDVSLSYSRVCDTKQKLIKHIKQDIVHAIRKPQYSFSENPDSEALFFYNLGNYREDHIHAFRKVAHLVEPHDEVLSTSGEKNDLIYALKSIPAFFQSISFARHNRWSVKDWICCLAYWFRIYHFKDFLKSVNLDKYKLVVVFCDVDAISSVLVQLAKRHGCATATIQHGTYIAPLSNPKRVDEDGIGFHGSTSDYFLAWNRFTQEEAIKTGVDKDKIRIVGLPKFIGCKPLPQHEPTGDFGVILGWADNDAENRRLIDVANEIGASLGMKYYLKYHPSFCGNEYEDITDPASYAGTIKKGIDLAEYVNQTDFSIVGNSSLFVELTYLGQLTFHLHCKDLPDKYENVKYVTFDTAEQLCGLYKKNTKLSPELREYLCGPNDPEHEYKDLFEKILRGEANNKDATNHK